jgi:Zn-dependent alcohol dehydrogenase
VGKRGRVVMTAIPHPADMSVAMLLFDLTLYEKEVRGSLFGSSNPRRDIFGIGR